MLILIEKLGMRKIFAMLIRQILPDEQKLRRLDNAADLSSKSYLLQKVIAGDKTWRFLYDTETKCQSMQ